MSLMTAYIPTKHNAVRTRSFPAMPPVDIGKWSIGNLLAGKKEHLWDADVQ